MRPAALAALVTGTAIPASGVYRRYRRDNSLESINVPTLVVHTKDDQVASHDASQRAAERIPGARFVSLASGGHLMIGQTKIVGDELARFFGEPDHGLERAAS